MHEYKIRIGDLIIAQGVTGLVTKTTRKYIYYIHAGREGRTLKETLWKHLDKTSNVDLSYSGMSRRRKQKKGRMLNLHGTKHCEVDEKVRAFLNFVELPCEIITGKSSEMKKIVEDIVREYDWTCQEQDSYNTGTLVVTEK